MYKNILISTDGSELAGRAVKHGANLAKSLGAKVLVLTVTTPYHIFTTETKMVENTPAEYTKAAQADAANLLASAGETVKAAGVACDTVQVEHEHVYQAIIDAAKAKGCDLIVMASHGRRGISAIVLGSETVKVLTHSRIPVLVHR
ncbi:MAG: universal stress protein [Candidatus Sulfotelmatobacter sp.]|jgi:nucleotide-binding universal stress UspA family protein